MWRGRIISIEAIGMLNMRLRFVFAVIMSGIVAAAAGDAPRVSIQTVEALPVPLPLPYSEQADAVRLVDQALDRAKQNGKRVLIDFGGNWCPDCRILAGIFDLQEVKAYLDQHYEFVPVDVGRLNRNLDLVQRFGIPKLTGVPAIVVADGEGNPLNISNTEDLSSPKTMSPQAVADWLAHWSGPDRK
jgi:thiol:disulfide interchange protein